MTDMYLFMATLIFILGFAMYLAIDYFRTPTGANTFLNKWTKKLLWIWLPFYALQRLIKEVIFKK